MWRKRLSCMVNSTAQRSAADYNNFLVYQSYLLQLQWVCLARTVPELGNLKLKTLEREKKGRNLKRTGRRGERIDSDINRRWRVREICIRKEISGAVQIRVGQRSQQTVEVCPWKGGTHLAVCHPAACCHPLQPVTHLFQPKAEKRQCSSSCVHDVENCIARSSCWRLWAGFSSVGCMSGVLLVMVFWFCICSHHKDLTWFTIISQNVHGCTGVHIFVLLLISCKCLCVLVV